MNTVTSTVQTRPGISLTDRERLSLSVHARRVPRESWAGLQDTHALVEQANALWQGVQREVDSIKAAAVAEGREQGQSKALAEMARHLAQAQLRARELLDTQDTRVIDLAAALVTRILPQLDASSLIKPLLAEALRLQQGERHLSVHVHPRLFDAVSAQLEVWKASLTAPPAIDCIADANLDALGLVVESEQGCLRVGVEDQLRSLTQALHRSLSEPRS